MLANTRAFKKNHFLQNFKLASFTVSNVLMDLFYGSGKLISSINSDLLLGP